MQNLDRKFIGKSFQDGDFEYKPPQWKAILDDLFLIHDPINHDEENTKDFLIKEDEVAIKHLKTGAIVRLTDDGYIDIFAGDQLGIRLDPQTNSINLFGERINLFGSQVHIRTKPHGFIWNGYSMNPELYYEGDFGQDLSLKGTQKKRVLSEKGDRWEEQECKLRPFVPPTTTPQYSQGMLEILKDLGLPVEMDE